MSLKKWIISKAWRWFGWNLSGKPVMFKSELAIGSIPVDRIRPVIPIIYKRTPTTVVPTLDDDEFFSYDFLGNSLPSQKLLDELNSRPPNVNNVAIRESFNAMLPYTEQELVEQIYSNGVAHGGIVCDLCGRKMQLADSGVTMRYHCPTCGVVYGADQTPIRYENPDYRTPEHGEQTGAYCDLNGTYQIFWDGIRKREVFICTSCKRIYDTVPQGGCACED